MSRPRSKDGGANPRDAAERRAEYTRLRLAGRTAFDAAEAVDVDPWSTGHNYEKWFRHDHPEAPPDPPAGFSDPREALPPLRRVRWMRGGGQP